LWRSTGEKVGQLLGERVGLNSIDVSAEVRRRSARLLTRLAAEKLRQSRVCAALEHLGGSEARKLLRELAAGAANARLTMEAKVALGRLDKRQAAETGGRKEQSKAASQKGSR
jgi:hypothetical protein